MIIVFIIVVQLLPLIIKINGICYQPRNPLTNFTTSKHQVTTLVSVVIKKSKRREIKKRSKKIYN